MCRLDCMVQRGSEQICANLLDVSEEGLCILSPVPLGSETFSLQIEIPGNAPVEVEAAIWHQRRVESATAGGSVWCIGMMLSKTGEGYEKLVPIAEDWTFESDERVDPQQEARAALRLHVFRVKVQSTRDTQTRLLTLAASSTEEARELAMSDLGEDWTVVAVHGT